MEATNRNYDNLRMLAVMAAVGYVNLLDGAAEDVAALAQVDKAALLDGLTEATATPEAIDCAHLTLMSMRPSEGDRLTVQWARVSRLYAGLKEWKRRKLGHPACVRGMVFFEERLANGDERSQRMQWFDVQRAAIMDRADSLAGADAVEYWTVPTGSAAPIFQGATQIRFAREDYRCNVDGLSFYFFRCQHRDDVRPALCTACVERLKASQVKPELMVELRRLLVMAAFGHEKGLEGAAEDIAELFRFGAMTRGVGSKFDELGLPTAEKLLDGLNPDTSPVPDIDSARTTLQTLIKMGAAQVYGQIQIGRLATALRQWVVPLAQLPDEQDQKKAKPPGPIKGMPRMVFLEGMDEARVVRMRLIEKLRRQIVREEKAGNVPASIETVEIPLHEDGLLGSPELRQLSTMTFRRQHYRCGVHGGAPFHFWRAESDLDKDTDARGGCERCALIMAMAFKKAPRSTECSA